MLFNDRLRAARIARGFKVQEMADYLNIALRSYQQYESGESRPTYEKFIMLADLLNVPADFLLCRDEFMQAQGIVVDVPAEAPPRRPGKKI